MIRKLLATTALATLIASGAYAQDTTQPMQTQPTEMAPGTTQMPETPMVIKAQGNLASKVIGKAVYNGTGDEAQKIGSVNDLVITPDGQVQALVIGVGGFLGIGQKDVAIEYDLAQWAERDNDRWLVVETTAEALKAQPEFDKQAYQPMPADADVAETKPATAEDLANAPVQQDADQTAEQMPADGAQTTQPLQDTAQAPATDDGTATDDQAAQAPAAEDGDATDQQAAQAPMTDDGTAADDQAAQAPAADESATDQTQTAAIDRSTLKDQPTDQIRADDFIGTTVYGSNDESVGEVGDVVLSQDGNVDAILIDVGGFLGIGEKEVALGLDNLQFMADENGKLYLYTNLSKETLEAQPAYDEGSYADNRDSMRLTLPTTR